MHFRNPKIVKLRTDRSFSTKNGVFQWKHRLYIRLLIFSFVFYFFSIFSVTVEDFVLSLI